MSKDNPELEKVGLQLDIVTAKGFDCHVCSGTRFSYNALGLVICGDCGIVYHVHALKEIYK